ncbi:predicted protein [Brucella abortus bv. 4 str. 292]|uniref:Uncharacterized protein n=19 Tax=Brucella TaxID=234 RepID=Q2YPR7_BRUA2|nr:hypothetical protein BR0065 [Brucella suis 1330]AAX73483.1 hypothetical protein BruAb1_0065 [Brucella abortus bv. 1 str. 9-941]ABQ60248.1 hypothetical protein BOV_0064 [Brucella ovis ATCC 25840]ABX61170.1 Hypothetical protein BCAN_A0066 [Brucella canis ATCC 23365]ABY37175.1 Hypothetical protein BSUIS_A0068 [Brucella suis ATCC 23445]ACN99885.1 Hypothetical protein, conserved [Brucella melitensis ATCC 23457]ACU47088.1 hypothetical protein BMI_I68 [Brucella microti CCM 4915]AEK53390.1 hypoth
MTMAKQPQNGAGRKTALGRRLLILMIVAILLVIALVWMSIYLFDPDGGINFDDLGIFAYDFNALIEWVARI